MITLEHINKTFCSADGDKVHAIKDVSLEIDEGDIYGIIGFSGAGKSTLVRCINLLECPEEGRIVVDGLDMMTLSLKELRSARKKIGMIFQHFNLMPSRTIFSNVAYPLKHSGLSKQEIKDKVHKLLELVEIADKENAYPNQLSGGQKQRVAIARALANDPKVLLCDEATSALDPQTTTAILQLIRKLRDELGITVVVITHEMEVVKALCDKVAVMEKGVLVEHNDVFSIFSNPQERITKDFIKTTSNLSKVYDLLELNSEVVNLKPGEVLAKLTYTTKDISEPLISSISRNFNLELNIIFADVEIVGGAPIGGTVVILNGESKNIHDALEFLKSKNVRVEVICHVGFSG